jgi:GH25 family lysozyme M1 (1,4-beta-N-acetylmuramidase)
MPSPVLDLSHHNPNPNWAQVRAAGVVGIIHKATEGSSYVDPTLFDRARAAMDAGLKWSTYHFLRPGSMQAQMQHYLGTVNPKPGERVCLDHEDTGVSLGQLEEAVQLLQADSRNLQVSVYSGHVIKQQLGDNHSAILARTSLWIAHYTSPSPTWPDGTWPMWSLWQWTDKEVIPGIDAPVDGDRWSGSQQELVAWFGPADSVPVPAPESKVLTISLDGLPDDYDVRLVVGGKEI